jgi:hypothetical protein
MDPSDMPELRFADVAMGRVECQPLNLSMDGVTAARAVAAH